MSEKTQSSAQSGIQSSKAPDIYASAYSYDLATAYNITEEQRETQSLRYPFFQEISRMAGGTCVVEGQDMLITGSNDYLGLAQDPRLKEAAQAAIEQYGTSCTGSRFLTGTLPLHTELERAIADFLGKEAAIVTSAGYLACMSALAATGGRRDFLYFDRENHASLYDGATLSPATMRRFPHNDLDRLEQMMQKDRQESPKSGALIVVDGVFSMSGEVVDLPRVVELAKKYGARLMVDDAHSLGVLGDGGRGTASHFGLLDEVDLVVGTFSKSLASVGGFIVGDAPVIDWIRHQARTFIFNAAGPASQVAVALEALKIMQQEPERQQQLWVNAYRFHEGLRGMGLDIMHSTTPIVPILSGDTLRTLIFWKELTDGGVFATPAVPPAVPKDMGLIRASITAGHTAEHVAELLRRIERAAKASELI